MRKFWVGDLPGQTTQQRYDLTPLVPGIESGFTLLTPNVRLAQRIKKSWDTLQLEQGAVTWESLKVHPLESWLTARWQESVQRGISPDKVVLDEQQALSLWRRAIDEEQQEGGQYSLMQSAAAATLAGQARDRLLRWQVDYTAEPHRQEFQFDTDCASFLAWSRRFLRYLEEQNLSTVADCLLQLAQCADQLPKTPILLVGFDDIPPLLRNCIQALGAPIETSESRATQARCSARRFNDRRQELASAAQWAVDINRHEPAARVGIVLTDMATDRTAMEYLLRKAFDALGHDYTSLPVNFSTGITLDRAPVVRDAMAVLRLGQHSVPASIVTALVSSRFLHLPDRYGAAVSKLLKQVSDSGKSTLQVADLRYAANKVAAGEEHGTALGKRLMSMSTLRSLRQSHLPSRWATLLNEVLDVWEWPGEGPLDSLEYQQVQRWYDTLEQLASYDDLTGAVSIDSLLSLLQRLLESRASQPQTADSMVQVLGPLEAAGLQFDYLWICGLQASRWPSPARPNPFIPIALQRRLLMPHATAEREWAIAESLMQQYRAGSSLLIASYAELLDGVQELPSVLIEGWDMVDGSGETVQLPDWYSQSGNNGTEVLFDDYATVPDKQELQQLRGGSALLEDQAQCPFRAFARWRLRAEPLGEAVQGVSQARRGSLLHRALHLLFSVITDSDVLSQTSNSGEAALIEQVVGQALDDIPRTGLGAAPPGWRELEGRRLARLLSQWLAVERQREAFRVAATEEELSVQLEALSLRLRVDRIDRMPDGSTLIVDYKSGKCQISDWLGDRPAKPQLPLYALASTALPSALAFAQLRIDECTFVGAGEQSTAVGIRDDIGGLVRGGWEVDSWSALNARWRDKLRLLAEEFLAGQARVDPQRGACTWCGLEALCRVDRELAS